jgi:hypothetical protein
LYGDDRGNDEGSQMNQFDGIHMERILDRFFKVQTYQNEALYSASLFDGCNPKDLSKLVNEIVNRLEQRFSELTWSEDDKKLLDYTISDIREFAKFLKKKKDDEEADELQQPYWFMICQLLSVIDSLLRKLDV